MVYVAPKLFVSKKQYNFNNSFDLYISTNNYNLTTNTLNYCNLNSNSNLIISKDKSISDVQMLNKSETLNVNINSQTDQINLSSSYFSSNSNTSLFNFICLNTRGAISNIDYLDDILKANHLIFLTETWLLNEQLIHFKNLSKNHNFIGKSDMLFKPNFGRQYKGRGFFLHKLFKIDHYEFISENVFICCFSINYILICFIGIYMPFDDKSTIAFYEFKSILELVKELSNFYFNKDHFVIIGGDFNSDTNRNNRFDIFFRHFLLVNNIYSTRELCKNTDFTYKSGDNYFSFIDYFLIFKYDFSLNVKCSILYNIFNNSDHNCVRMEINLNVNNDKINSFKYKDNSKIKLCYMKPNFKLEETKTKFIDYVNQYLNNFDDAYLLENNQLIVDCMYDKILFALKSANDNLTRIITIKEFNKFKKIWFTDELLEIKKKMNIFKENKDVDNYKIHRAKYRRLQRHNIRLYEQKQFHNIERLRHEKDKTKFWKYVYKTREKNECKSVNVPIMELENHYKNLFDNHFDINNMNEERVNNDIVDLCKNNFEPIILNINDFNSTLKKTNNSNVCGEDLVSSKMILNSGDFCLNKIIFNFFSFIFAKCIFPKNLNVSHILPIIKDFSKPTNIISNLRPLSISNAFCQLLERLLLILMPNLLSMHQNQFGFKPKTSCTHALFALNETIITHTEENQHCYFVTLDAEKAFDKIWRNGLFYKLKYHFPRNLVIMLKLYYETSCGKMKVNGNLFSKSFPIKCGVKQGGILSPYLFNFFMHDLIVECLSLNIGANIYGVNISTFLYADDVSILGKELHEIQQLLNICENYGSDWGINFSGSKSKFIVFGTQRLNDSILILKNLKLELAETIKFLGIFFNYKLDFSKFILEKFQSVRNSFFSLNSCGLRPHGINPHLQSYFYKTFCLSKLVYGLEFMNLNSCTIKNLDQQQNSLIKYMLGTSKYSHVTDIFTVLKLFRMKELYIFSKLSFLKNLKKNKICTHIFNNLIINKLNFCNNNSKSFIRDIKAISFTLNINIYDLYDNIDKHIENYIDNLRFIDENDFRLMTVKNCIDNLNSNGMRDVLHFTVNYK
jgi:hypothetical protein